MIGQSGCFGCEPNIDTIDNAAEVSAAVDEIIQTVTPAPEDDTDDEQAAASVLLAQHYAFMDKRVRLLTWAVVALAVYLMLKEI